APLLRALDRLHLLDLQLGDPARGPPRGQGPPLQGSPLLPRLRQGHARQAARGPELPVVADRLDDDGRPPVPPPAPKRVVGGGTRIMVPAVPLSVPCARCERMIAAMDVRSGKADEVGGKLYCHRCKHDFDAAKHKIEKRVAKSLVCAHCGRSISAKEVNDKKVAYNEGNIYCATCSKDPGILLR